jgi:elongation of very long chain fatty acids protein 6
MASSQKVAAARPPMPVHGFTDRIPSYLSNGCLAACMIHFGNEWYGNDFTRADMTLLNNYTYEAPIYALLPYVLMVHVVKPIWASCLRGNGGKLGGFADGVWNFVMRCWNSFLTVLSIAMLFGMAIPLYQQTAIMSGFHEMVCDPQQTRWNGPIVFWLYVFAISKFFELFDTVILVARNKPVNFLHWYHHVTVLAFTWFAVEYQYSPGYMFAVVNCFVHSVMYDYYMVRAYGIKLNYDRAVTRIQILQMVFGIIVNSVWVWQWFQNPAACPARSAEIMIGCAVVMYGSYFFLFATFYIARYNKAKKTNKAKKAN